MKNILGRARRGKDDPLAEAVTAPSSDAAPPAEIQPAQVAEQTNDRWVGYIDHIDRSVITGWCFDRENPFRSLAVEVVASNGKSKRTIAAIFRQDVKDAGYGNGNLGFELDLAGLGLKNEELMVRFVDSKVAISKLPFSLDPQRALLDGKLPTSYTGAMQMIALDVQARHAELERISDVRQA